MENLRTIRLKKLFIFLLPVFTAIISGLAIWFTSYKCSQINLQQTYIQEAQAQIESLPELDMNMPETKYYYDKLYEKNIQGGSNTSKELACKLYEQFEDNIDNIVSGTPFNLFSGITSYVSEYSDAISTELQNAVDAFSMDYPILSSMFSFEFGSATLQSFIISTTIPTNSSISDFTDLINGINEMTEIADSFNFDNTTTDYEKVLIAHDFIINNTTYQTGADLNQTAYSALINGSTVCAGYAKSFKYLMDSWGIESILVSGLGGDKANPESHMWNYVKLNNVWWCIDLTWDDSGDILNYDYFLIDFPTFTDDGLNVHTVQNQFQYTGGSFSEMVYTFPTPSNSDYNYPKNPESNTTYTVNIDTSINEMVLDTDYSYDTITPVKRGNYVLIEFTLLDDDAFFLVEPNSITSDGSTPIFVSKTSGSDPVYTYKVIITDSDCNIVFNFDTYLHDITLTPLNASDGTATLSKTEAEKDEVITITINLTNSASRSVKNIIIKDASNQTIGFTKVTENQEYTFLMPSTDTTVEIVIATVYTISQGTIHNGSAVLVFSKTTAMEGETINVEVKSITTGMRATSLSSDTVSEFTSLGKKTNRFTFVMPAASVVVNATLELIPPTVETKDFKIDMIEGNGTISYSTESLEVGEEVTITIKPEFGKKLKSIYCEGVKFTAVEEGLSYSFVVPSEDFEIELEFEDKFGFDSNIAVYAVCGVVGFIFILFLFTAFPRKHKNK